MTRDSVHLRIIHLPIPVESTLYHFLPITPIVVSKVVFICGGTHGRIETSLLSCVDSHICINTDASQNNIQSIIRFSITIVVEVQCVQSPVVDLVITHHMEIGYQPFHLNSITQSSLLTSDLNQLQILEISLLIILNHPFNHTSTYPHQTRCEKDG